MTNENIQELADEFMAPECTELNALLTGYEVTNLIACGGMGAVYRARQKRLDREVAIKILRPELGADPQYRESFESEARAMARLNHPNLIGVYDFGEVDEFLFIIMELVEGKSLFHSAHGKAIEQQEVARLVHGICEGLAHAHEAGIVHRDIKPANILLDTCKRPRIGDFGLARPTDGSGGDGLLFGTPGYTAPEVMVDAAIANKRSDVFSTGVLLYELLTGELPAKRHVPPSQFEGVDPRFDQIVRRALHPSPAMRFADAGEMAEELGVLKEALGKPARRIVTAPSRPARLLRATPSVPAPAATPALSSSRSQGLNLVLLRNLIIIAVLLTAIFGISKAHQWKKRNLAEEKRRYEAEEEKRRLERLAEEEAKHAAWVRQQRLRFGERWKEQSEHEGEDNPGPQFTPLEILDRLKPDLAAGGRTFPPDTLERGDRRLFFVDRPMSWRDASAFAEAHGGHLATLADGRDQTWLSEWIPKDRSVWLGGRATGRSGWGWVDGGAWKVRKPATSASTGYASLNAHGSIRSSSGRVEYPFFIQWHMNGNPGSLASQLERLVNSLKLPDPLYPPGTISFENGHYLIIERAISWGEAESLARTSGGHLAVPSYQRENLFLEKAVTSALPEGRAAWIGGQLDDRDWVWVTEESPTFGAWVKRTNSPDGDRERDTAMRLVAGSEGGWDDADPNDENAAAAFVIEWSKSLKLIIAKKDPVPDLDWAVLQLEATKLLTRERAQHAKGIAANGVAYDNELVNWFNKQGARVKRETNKAILAARAIVLPGGRIDEGKIAKLPGLRPDINAACGRRVLNQRKIDNDYDKQLDTIRRAYVERLNKKIEEAGNVGMVDKIRAIEEEIEACGATGAEFLRRLVPTP